MSLINCSKSDHLSMVNLAETRGTSEERSLLRTFGGRSVFSCLHDGRVLALCTWLMVARADQRGRHALRKVTLQAQHELVAELRASCPVFFAGTLVEEDSPGQAAGTSAAPDASATVMASPAA